MLCCGTCVTYIHPASGLCARQAHPWFKKDFPENLDLHKVNAAYVDMAQSRLNEGSIEIIDRVIHEACAGVDTRPPAIAGNGCSLGDLDDFMDGLDLEQ